MSPESIAQGTDWPARVSSGLLALLAVLPFLEPRHVLPLASFWAEWWAIACGVAAGAVVLLTPRAWRPCRIPTLAVVPAALVAVLLLQYAFGIVVTVQQGLLYGAYLLWLLMLLVVGHQLAVRRGLAAVADVLAWALLAGAVASAAIGVGQCLDPYPGHGWIFPRLGAACYGNLTQPNHQSHYLWLGVASALYLHCRGNLPGLLTAIACLPLLAVSVLAGSRSVLLYATALPAWTAWMRFRHPASAPARLLPATLLLLPVLLMLHGLPHWLPCADPAGTGLPRSPLEHLYQEVSGTHQRLALIITAAAAFLDHPFLGGGAGAFPWLSFAHAMASSLGGQPMVGEHAHNIIMQLAVEFGGPATLLFAGLVAHWGWCQLRRPASAEVWWVGSVAAIGGIHSLLEYPLWYAYFGGLAAVVLGAADRTAIEIAPGRRGVAYALAALVAAGAILMTLATDYARLESVGRHLTGRPEITKSQRQWAVDTLLMLRRDSLLAPWAGLTLMTIMDVEREQLAERRRLCERALHFSAVRVVAVKCAVLAAIDGQADEARSLLGRTLLAFPSARAETIDEIRELEGRFPELESLRRLADKL